MCCKFFSVCCHIFLASLGFFPFCFTAMFFRKSVCCRIKTGILITFKLMTTYKSRIRTKKFLSIFIEFNHNFREIWHLKRSFEFGSVIKQWNCRLIKERQIVQGVKFYTLEMKLFWSSSLIVIIFVKNLKNLITALHS